MSKTYKVYEGPSMLNGEPILALLTPDSDNRKTGPMAQLWILPAKLAPHLAQRTGADAAVCGDCPFRPTALGSYVKTHDHEGQGGCYVTTFQGPRSTWEANRRKPADLHGALEYLRGLTGRAVLRLGAYGDPSALPRITLALLVKAATGRVTGYSHQWRQARFGWLKAYVMASVESERDALIARAQGWRTFRVASEMGEWPLVPAGEVICLNESRGLTCAECGLCNGLQGHGRSVVIPAHGHSVAKAKAVAHA